MRKIVSLLVAATLLFSCQTNKKEDTQTKDAIIISENVMTETVKALKEKFGDNNYRIEKGVKQAANLWRASDGNTEDFKTFCMNNFINNAKELDVVFLKVSRNFEIIYGYNNLITLQLLEPIHLTYGEPHSIDNIFGAYSPYAHINEDFYNNKIAFIIALNFPSYTLKEKSELGKEWSRKDWAYARLGDMFTSRVPANLLQAVTTAETNADIYIADYNIFVGELVNDKNQTLFPKGMKLLSHWNLRDEIKSNYADKEGGLEKQEMIYEVMKRIISQEIPEDVINSEEYQWNPYTNKTYKDGKEFVLDREPDTRYQQIINNYHALREVDAYSGNMDTYIKRKFEGSMEIAQPDVEVLFDKFLSSPQAKMVGDLIKKRLGRDLKPFDIWYDGFKARSSINQEKLDMVTQQRYPNAKALEADLGNMLLKLGFSKDRAEYISSKISVDPARGSGHAWGASMKGDKAHLRTRIPASGMDYKGYNIAVHEFGHNVEQTISLYDVDYYMLNGVPNTAFTEALAFIFQKRDLFLLDIKDDNKEKEYLQTLDNFWSIYEIMGVSMVDMKVWKWLYEHPEADAEQLRVAVETIAKDVWNKYYAPVFGIKDQTILGIYSHMVASPLYLTAYSFGHLIDFQIEQYIADKKFDQEVSRIFKIGRLIPNAWMNEAVGSPISVDPVLNATSEAVKYIK
jgi:hypothetical protein